MQAETGHYYALGLVLDGPLAVSSDWIPAPLSRRYPAEVVSVTPARKSADGLVRSEAVIRWDGAPGVLEEGDSFQSDISMVSMGAGIGLGAMATVASVTDLGLKIISSGATLTNYLIAAVLVGFTVYASWGLKPERAA